MAKFTLHHLSNLIIPMLLGALVFLFSAAAFWYGGMPLRQLGVRAADIWTVQTGGPRLGRRAVSDEIVLVMFDLPTGSALGYVRSYEDDVSVYRSLVQAGAAIVYDSRMAIVAEQQDLETCRPLLESMLQFAQENPRDDSPVFDGDHSVVVPRVIREIWFASNLQDESIDKYASLAIQNVVSSHPHLVPSLRSRVFPLAYVSNFGTRESAPLVIARHLWQIYPDDPASVPEELIRCGVVSAWHRQNPELVGESDMQRDVYRIGNHEVVWHPMATTSILVPPAGFWVSYDPDISAYRRLSYIDVLRSADSRELDVAGKAVIIGYSLDADPSSDTYEVPSGSGKVSVAEVIAAATQTLLDGRTQRELPHWLAFASLFTVCIGMALICSWARPVIAIVATLAFFTVYLLVATLIYRHGWFIDFLILPFAGFISAVLGGTFGAWSNHRSHRRVIDIFGRYVPRAVVDQLIRRPQWEKLQLGGSRRDVTVMFADVRGFTSFSESLSPEEVVTELNRLLQIMVDCTFEFEGTLDKFIGDAILVLFNAPLDQPDHVVRAVKMATVLQSRLAQDSHRLKVGIGIHVGQAVVGNIGTPQRMEYTAIGNTVNIASRLCDLAPSGSIVVSQAVIDQLSDEYHREPLGIVQIKGLTQSISTWSIQKSH